MTLDRCEVCHAIYYTSGFFPHGAEVPEGLKLLMSVTEEQLKAAMADDSRYGNACGHCTASKLKEMGLV